jgi:hypothetical protein
MAEYADQRCQVCEQETTHEDGKCLICDGAIEKKEIQNEYYDIRHKE